MKSLLNRFFGNTGSSFPPSGNDCVFIASAQSSQRDGAIERYIDCTGVRHRGKTYTSVKSVAYNRDTGELTMLGVSSPAVMIGKYNGTAAGVVVDRVGIVNAEEPVKSSPQKASAPIPAVETRELAAPNGEVRVLRVRGLCHVKVLPDSSPLKLSTEAGIFGAYAHSLKDGELEIRLKSSADFDSTDVPEFTVGSTALREIDTDNLGDVTVEKLSGDSVTIDVAGDSLVIVKESVAAEVRITAAEDAEVQLLKSSSQRVSVDASGDAVVILEGTTDTLDADITEDAALRAGRCVAKQAALRACDDSDVRVAASGSATGRALDDATVCVHHDRETKTSVKEKDNSTVLYCDEPWAGDDELSYRGKDLEFEGARVNGEEDADDDESPSDSPDPESGAPTPSPVNAGLYKPATTRKRGNVSVSRHGNSVSICGSGNSVSSYDGDVFISSGSSCFINGRRVSGPKNNDTGRFVEKELTVSGLAKVDSIENESIADVVFAQGDTPSVSICADESVIEWFTARVSRGTLTCDMRSGSFATSLKPYFKVVIPASESLSLETHSSGDFQVDSLVVKTLSIGTHGSGDVEIDSLQASELDASTNGSGDVRIAAGAVENASLDTNGSGDVELGCAVTGRATCSTNGSGDVRARVTGRVSASTNGSGDIRITGRPTVDRKREFGTGSISIH